MRTSLSLDDDIFFAVKERARRENRSAGSVLSDLARQALHRGLGTPPTKSGEEFFGFEPLGHRGSAISNALIDRIRDEESV